jgi:hypothetical protein
MRNSIVFLAIIIVFSMGCKTQKSCCSKDDGSQAVASTKGTVSHQFRAGGCATVIMVDKEEGATDQVILIPKDPLPSKFDKDGLKVKFNYHPLKMPNPEGCTSGFPAEITDLQLQ